MQPSRLLEKRREKHGLTLLLQAFYCHKQDDSVINLFVLPCQHDAIYIMVVKMG